MLTKTVTVLDMVEETPVYVVMDEEGREHKLTVDRVVWMELGYPSQITVTIEPGDVLNG